MGVDSLSTFEIVKDIYQASSIKKISHQLWERSFFLPSQAWSNKISAHEILNCNTLNGELNLPEK